MKMAPIWWSASIVRVSKRQHRQLHVCRLHSHRASSGQADARSRRPDRCDCGAERQRRQPHWRRICLQPLKTHGTLCTRRAGPRQMAATFAIPGGPAISASPTAANFFGGKKSRVTNSAFDTTSERLPTPYQGPCQTLLPERLLRCVDSKARSVGLGSTHDRLPSEFIAAQQPFNVSRPEAVFHGRSDSTQRRPSFTSNQGRKAVGQRDVAREVCLRPCSAAKST